MSPSVTKGQRCRLLNRRPNQCRAGIPIREAAGCNGTFDGTNWGQFAPPLTPPRPPPKKAVSPKSILAVVGAILLLIIVGKACGHGGKEDSSSTSTSNSTSSSNAAAAAPTTPQGPKPPANVKALNISPPPGPDVDVVTARYKIGENLTKGLTKDGARIDTVDILKYIKAAYPNLTEVHVDATADMVDQYGNTSEDQVATLIYSRATLDKINWDNFNFQNIWNIPIADSAEVHPAFQY